jgi:hypothetical protein
VRIFEAKSISLAAGSLKGGEVRVSW